MWTRLGVTTQLATPLEATNPALLGGDYRSSLTAEGPAGDRAVPQRGSPGGALGVGMADGTEAPAGRLQGKGAGPTESGKKEEPCPSGARPRPAVTNTSSMLPAGRDRGRRA